MQIFIDSAARARLERAAKATGRTVEDLAASAVEEAALDWDKANPDLSKSEQHPMKAGIDQSDQPDLHRHPIHDAIETEGEGER
jgi:hypothetical protein